MPSPTVFHNDYTEKSREGSTTVFRTEVVDLIRRKTGKSVDLNFVKWAIAEERIIAAKVGGRWRVNRRSLYDWIGVDG